MKERKYETGFYWVKLMKDDKFEIAKCINHCGKDEWSYCGIRKEALLIFKTENFSEIGDKIEIPIHVNCKCAIKPDGKYHSESYYLDLCTKNHCITSKSLNFVYCYLINKGIHVTHKIIDFIGRAADKGLSNQEITLEVIKEIRDNQEAN